MSASYPKKFRGGLTGKQFRKAEKARRHGLSYSPERTVKRQTGRRAKAAMAKAKTAKYARALRKATRELEAMDA